MLLNIVNLITIQWNVRAIAITTRKAFQVDIVQVRAYISKRNHWDPFLMNRIFLYFEFLRVKRNNFCVLILETHQGAFCGMVLFSCFLWNIAPTLIPNETSSNSKLSKQSTSKIFRAVAFYPLILASYVATSRIVDNRHFAGDVITGSCIGACIAIMCCHI